MNEAKFNNLNAGHAQAMLELYKSAGWTQKINLGVEQIIRLIKNSDYSIGAFVDNSLKGFIRGLSDGICINFIQDVLVHPDYHRQGIGSRLMKLAQALYPDVHKMILTTDNEPYQQAFYESLKFINSKDSTRIISLNCYVKFLKS